jgi:enediyne biosynthesis protein E4
MRTPIALAGLALLSLGACTSRQPGPETLFTRMDAGHSSVTFENRVVDSPSFNMIEYLNYYNGGGIAAGDIDNDGLIDLYFVANQGENRMYRNLGGFRFEDITEKAGLASPGAWKTGVVMTDLDGDGDLDIYLSRLGDYKGITGRNELYINNGDGTFTERAPEYGLDFCGFSTHAVFFDYDLDGDLDVFLLNHSVHSRRSYGPSTLRLEKDSLSGDRLYRQDQVGGRIKFTDVTASAGIYSSAVGYGLSVSVADLNGDGYPDIYVANDFHENDYLYLNQQDGTFRESILGAMNHNSRSSMGSNIADFNNDGLPDVMVLDMLPYDEEILKRSGTEDENDISEIKLRYGYHHQISRNNLQLNRGAGRYSDIALQLGVAATDWSWAPLFCDLDNDGWKDLYITNGIYRRPDDLDYIRHTSDIDHYFDRRAGQDSIDRMLIRMMPHIRLSNPAFANRGGLRFEEVTSAWGLDHPSYSNGGIYADLDNDGDLDLVVNNHNETATVYRNNAERLANNHYLRIRLEGGGQNTAGIGAILRLYAGALMQYEEVQPVRGFQSSMHQPVHFGLGARDRADSLVVTWPGGARQVLRDLPADTTLILRQEDGAILAAGHASPSPEPLFREAGDLRGIDFAHRENPYRDWEAEPLIPHRLSAEGPKAAVGDFNGDGLDDLFIGGARGQAGALFLQDSHGAFQRLNQPVLFADRGYEDVGVAAFDADGDGDPDLVVSSGGNEVGPYQEFLEDRLYLNDGKGLLTRSQGMLPPAYINSSCVRPVDYDGDGDIDLFIGGRSVPGSYGLPALSRLLENDGQGRFTDVTARLLPELQQPGMVTDAAWADLDGDGRPDLVVTGEWMPLLVFFNRPDGFARASGEDDAAQSSGWWQCLLAHDLDGDGDTDLLAGNFGLNSKVKASHEHPATLHVGDFDSNGRTDPILSAWRGGSVVPLATLDELIAQVFTLKSRFPTYAAFSEVKWAEDLFDRKLLQGALRLQAVEMRSCWFENTGNGSFRKHMLPDEAQFSPIKAFYAEDFNGDGRTDLLCAGNHYASSVTYGRYDAGLGLYLEGLPEGGFRALPAWESGVIVPGDHRDIVLIRNLQIGKMLLVSRNDQAPVLYTWNQQAYRTFLP